MQSPDKKLTLYVTSISEAEATAIDGKRLGRVDIRYHVTDADGATAEATITLVITDQQRKCTTGHVLQVGVRGYTCVACEPGTYEFNNLVCMEVDSLHYINNSAAVEENKRGCGAQKQHRILYNEHGVVEMQAGRRPPPPPPPPHLLHLPPAGAQRRESASMHVHAGHHFALSDRPAVRPSSKHHLFEVILNRGYTSAEYDRADGAGASCPSGGFCHGGLFEPIAQLSGGYGQLGYDRLTNEPLFFKCAGCVTGSVLPSFNAHNCTDGYLNGSNLCATCEADLGYALVLKECINCASHPGMLNFGYGSGWYVVVSAVVTLLWFPILRELVGKRYGATDCAGASHAQPHTPHPVRPSRHYRYKSLYVTNNYVQFVGVFAGYNTPLFGPVRELLEARIEGVAPSSLTLTARSSPRHRCEI